MSAAAKLALVNLWSTATISGTGGVANYPNTNVKTPQRPLATYRSTTTTNVEVIADHATAKSAQLFTLHNVNFTLVHVQANATNPTNAGLGSATFQSGPQAIRRDSLGAGRYNLAFLNPAPVIFRWHRWFIPTQTPTAAPFDAFEIGGISAGPLVEIPRGWRWGMQFDPVDPLLRVESSLPPNDANEYLTGDRKLRISATRQALIEPENISAWGVDDMLEEFRTVDRAWVDARFGAFWLNRGSSAHVWIMRARPQRWTVDFPACESAIELEEVIRGA